MQYIFRVIKDGENVYFSKNLKEDLYKKVPE